MKHGFGVLTFANGEIYTGHFYQGKAHGQGRRLFQNGDCYSGEWRDGVGTGQGSYNY